jgi:tRNA(fMet)-specific endonuclease VapC
MDCILDTNAVSELLRQNEMLIKKINEITDTGSQIFISIITDYEIRRGLFATNATKKLKSYEKLREQYRLLWLDDLKLSEEAARIHSDLRQKGQPIPDADILIAASALANNLTVITNDEHFLRIPGLKVESCPGCGSVWVFECLGV